LSNPQFFNRRSSFLATVQPTPDLHRRSTFQPRLPTRPQLAPPGLSPALPSNSTSRLSSAVRFFSWLSRQVSSLRLQPALPLNLLADPSTRVSVSALRTAFRFNLRLSPPAVPPACLSTCLKLALFGLSSGSAFLPISSLRLQSTLQPCLRT